MCFCAAELNQYSESEMEGSIVRRTSVGTGGHKEPGSEVTDKVEVNS